MRNLLFIGAMTAFASFGHPAFAENPNVKPMKMTNGACGKTPRTLQCALRGFDPKPDTKTPIPFQLGSGKKDD